MTNIFLKILNMSISAGWIVLVVLLLRVLLKKAPKWITVLLWGIVAVRLICPVSVESVLSLIPSAETISPEIMMESTPEINTGIPFINNTLNPVISDSFTPNPAASANPLQIWIPIFAIIWIGGMLVLLAYTVVSYCRLRKKIGTAVLLKDNIFQSESVVSPFVLGIVKPRIYMPFHVSKQDIEHVIAHEQAHIRRKDYLWKPLGFLLLMLHWFNPLMWLGYVLLCRDIELACDEKVIKELNHDQKADYSQALLTCSVNRRMISACPLAFGEVSVKGRVKSVLNYRKPAFWMVIAAIVVSIIVAVCFLTNPKTSNSGIVPDAASIHTEYDGVYLSVESIDTKADENKVFNIVWHNETPQEIIYGDSYSIEYKDGEEWKDVSKEELIFHAIGYLLMPNSTREKSYSTQRFDLSKNGTYRLRCGFSVNDHSEYIEYNTWIEFEMEGAVSDMGAEGEQSAPAIENDYIVTEWKENDGTFETPISIKTPVYLKDAPVKILCTFDDKEQALEEIRRKCSNVLSFLMDEFNMTDEINDSNWHEYRGNMYAYLNRGADYGEEMDLLDGFFDIYENDEANEQEIMRYLIENATVGAEIEGKYSFHDLSITLFDNGRFTFIFSVYSSYVGLGDYDLEENRLTLRTDDGKHIYFFDIVDDALIFDAGASSDILWPSDIFDRAVFR